MATIPDHLGISYPFHQPIHTSPLLNMPMLTVTEEYHRILHQQIASTFRVDPSLFESPVDNRPCYCSIDKVLKIQTGFDV